jgi:formylglycine-generating enzyme required for sulfatase activity
MARHATRPLLGAVTGTRAARGGWRRLASALAVAASLAAVPLTGVAASYRLVPGGPFDSVLPQDSGERAATVNVAPFEMRDEPVTLGEYLAFLHTHPEWQRGKVPPVFADTEYLQSWSAPLVPPEGVSLQAPVTGVSWFAARAYCESEGARLPTWLEWESAAAADETRADARKDPKWQQRVLGWYETPAARTLPAVGGTPDVHGLHDLHGLVWEWVDDFNALFISGDSRTQGDPEKQRFCGSGAIAIVGRDSYAVLMRVAFLSSLEASSTARSLGFRCARPPAAGVSR